MATAAYGYCTKEKAGLAKVTFGNFDVAEKCHVKFKVTEDDTYCLSLYRDSRYNKPYKEEMFKGSELCGLDWGSFEKQKKVMKYFYKPPKMCTYVTIINKTKSISLLFSSDEGEQLSDWRYALQQLLYGGRTYIREKLNYEGQNIMLQVGKDNICLTEDKRGSEPARRKHSWNKEMFYECTTNGRVMTMTFKSPYLPCTNNVMLECLRGGCQDGKILSQEETVSRIKTSLFEFVVCYWFTKEKIYEDLQESVIYMDYGSDIYDLNKLEDVSTYGGREQMRSSMHKVYQKVKDSEGHYTEPNNTYSTLRFTQDEQFVVNVGHVIQQIRANPPLPDTLYLPAPVRTDICLKLYTDTEMGTTGDWTALASEIGIKQGSVNTVKGILANERSLDPAAEIILRHWQHTHNKYWDKPESEYPDRPRHPCTKEGLIKALKNIGRNDLALIVSGEVKYLRGGSASENQYEDVN